MTIIIKSKVHNDSTKISATPPIYRDQFIREPKALSFIYLFYTDDLVDIEYLLRSTNYELAISASRGILEW